ncbi:hypothetical protein [Paraburkholderia lacunae]|uniref:Uncharacterized protein n=1 Tax=Paraburkholderia lacunae TaxID=2211104 RepID=A0A370N7M7_9BURK|nr:hypothetical protein [Paraburkholderia lacunae]RDK01620.1 hypothetical protein DLM46_17620 [Paraburkholderia lacunae]
MKKTPAAAAPANEFADLEALREFSSLLEQRSKLEALANEIPAQIASAQSEIDAIGAKTVDSELASLEVTEKQLSATLKQREDLEQQQVECGLRLRRLQTRLNAIEAKMPDIDAQIDLAIGAIRIEAAMASEAIQVELAEEIRSKVADLQAVYAKVRALQRLIPMARTSDFILDAYLPDLETCMRIESGTGNHYNRSPNLLAVTNPDTHAAEAQITDALKPITDALIRGRNHKSYVPLAKRPQPYIRKSIVLEGSSSSIGAELARQR